jgi:hypothetical protein
MEIEESCDRLLAQYQKQSAKRQSDGKLTRTLHKNTSTKRGGQESQLTNQAILVVRLTNQAIVANSIDRRPPNAPDTQ